MSQPAVETPEYLTEVAAAAILRLSSRTLQRYRRDKKGPPYTRMGDRKVFYQHADVVAWANGRRVG